MSDNFTTDELIVELLNARPAPGDDPTALTMNELQAATGKPSTYIARQLRRLIDAGQAEAVRKPVTRIDGARAMVPAYRMTGGKKGDD